MTMYWGEPKFCQSIGRSYAKSITIGDINSFFMLFFDNFSSLLGILGEMVFIPLIVLEFNPMSVPVGIGSNSDKTVADYYNANAEVVFTKVCPGIAFALVAGNLWYAWMAMKLAGKEERMDITALPYGINTPAGFLTVFMVQLSIMFAFNPRAIDISPEDFADKTWKGACAVNFVGGLFEIAGIHLGEIMRKFVPRAALFAPVCGVGFVWLGFNPLIDVMREPLIGFLPLFLAFSGFFAKGAKGIYPSGLPVAFVMMLIGTLFWWTGLARHDTEKRELNEPEQMGRLLNQAYETYAGKNTMQAFTPLAGFDSSIMNPKYIAIVFPIALASFVETIENVEMAHLIGDSYNVKEAMLADGIGTCIGAIFGSVIPTTVYIGHVRHKAAGARWFYSVLNAFVYFIIMMSGLIAPLFYSIDQVSVGCILITVGLTIVQTAMEVSASRHYPCLMIGIMFALSEMIYFDHFDETVRVSTRSIGRMKGVMNMAPGGGIMCSLVVTAFLCDVVDSRYGRAAVWCLLAALFSFFGLMHGANYIYPDGRIISTIGTSDADFYTTDLGELTFSLPVVATHLSFQDPATDSGYVTPYTWQYIVNDLGFQDPFRCTPWDLDYGNASGTGHLVPNCMVCGDFAWGFAGAAPAHTTVAQEFTHGTDTFGKQPAFTPSDGNGRIQAHPYNEGWRFGVAYLFLALVMIIHYFACQKYGIEATMDNGYASLPSRPGAEKKVSAAAVEVVLESSATSTTTASA